MGRIFIWSKTICGYIILHFHFESRFSNVVLIISFLSKLTKLLSNVYMQDYKNIAISWCLKLSWTLFCEYYLLIIFLIFLGNHFNTQTMAPLSYAKRRRYRENIEKIIESRLLEEKNIHWWKWKIWKSMSSLLNCNERKKGIWMNQILQGPHFPTSQWSQGALSKWKMPCQKAPIREMKSHIVFLRSSIYESFSTAKSQDVQKMI